MENASGIIIPVASGKGGVGKSVLTANLAISLAEAGYSTIAIDLDLGGSNLHSYLGLSNDFAGIGDYVRARTASLEDLLIPTGTTNLRIIPGDVRTPMMANFHHAQKIKLINDIKKLEAHYILLDLGAGSSFNTLDMFGMSSRSLLITTPEYPAIMNMQMFLKNFIFRRIEGLVKSRSILLNLVHHLFALPHTEVVSVERICREIETRDRDIAQKIRTLCATYRPRIIYNMGQHYEDVNVAQKIDKSLYQMLSMEIDHFGFVFSDSEVTSSTRGKTPLLRYHRDSVVAQNIIEIADRIIRLWPKKLSASSERLHQNAQKNYEQWFHGDSFQ
ncbi:MAG: P-loop NTPase [SAR324 cluster bacterium]|nr:P-loop NTPase [SAR324 cluster bacterium]